MTSGEGGDQAFRDEAERARPGASEPALRAPVSALLLAASFVVLYAVQLAAPEPDQPVARFGFSPADLAEGRWTGLFTALFVHGGWAHAFLNALGCLAFGAPVARLFGPGKGVAAFFAFFLVCGALASLGYAALHWGAPHVLIGASGAVSGLMGAASRLIDRRFGLAPFTSRTVVSMALAWLFVNAVVAMVGLGGVAGDAPIAWEAHLVGYAVGLALVGPTLRLLRR
jgi:membrane associated rhomboid family serine protease